MAGFGKLALTALAVSLLPYEVKKDEDGGISYKSLLVNVKARKDDDGSHKVELSFFNKPDFVKSGEPEVQAEAEADVTIRVSTEEIPAEEVPAEDAAPAEEAVPAEDAVAEEDFEEAPAEAQAPQEPVNE